MMLKKLFALISTAAFCVSLAASGSAAVLDPINSTFKVNLAALPTITINGYNEAGNTATLTNGVGAGHDIDTEAGLFQGVGITAGTATMTGIPILINMTLTATNNAASYTSAFGPTANPWGGGLTVANPNFSASSGVLCPTGCLGAGGTANSGTFSGAIILEVGAPGPPGPSNPSFPLAAIGLGGTNTITLLGAPIVATGGPWVTGKVQITGVTTNVISIPGRGGVTGPAVELFLTPNEAGTNKVLTTLGGFTSTMSLGVISTTMTVQFGGTQNLASSVAGGTVTMISPTRVNTGPLGQGTIPGVFRQTFTFVPEPGTVLLLVSGAAGLVALGRKRMGS